MIERHRHEGLAHLGIAGDDAQLVRGEMLAGQSGEQLGKSWCQFGRLDQHAVASGERCRDRRDGKLEGVVPGRDDAHETKRLRQQAIAARQERQGGGDTTLPHPAFQMRQRVADAGAHDEQFGKARLMRRAAAKVGTDRRANVGLMLLGQRQQAFQAVFPHTQIGKGLLLEGRALQLEPFAEDILSHLQHRTLPGSPGQAYILT